MQLQKREKQTTKPQVSERKESLLALPSESGFVKTKGIKIQALLADNVNNIFERNLNSFLDLHKKTRCAVWHTEQ